MTDRPNILVITSDQHRGDCYGFEGRRIKTPHLDEMARQGTRFGCCITPNNVCQPSRASMLTGLLPNTHGVHDNGIDLLPEIGDTGFAAQLAKSGYNTGYIGKAHFATSHTFASTGTPECRHSTQMFDENWNGPYMGFEHLELMVEGHNQWLPMKPPMGQHYESWYYADGRGDERNVLYKKALPPETGAAQTWHSALPPAWHNSTWIGDRTVQYLNDHKDEDEPFCCWASFPDPHHPFDAPDPWSRMHNPEDVELPPERDLDLDRRPWWHRASLEGLPDIQADLRKIREEYSRIPSQNDDQLRQIIANYYGMISLIDHNVGRILMALDDLGLSENTIVIFTSDHGDWLGDHGIILKGPINYDGLMRVGFIVKGPGVPAGKVVDDPISTIDMKATIEDYAGVTAAREDHSTSLRGLIEGNGETRNFAFNEWDINASRCGVALNLQCVRTKTHKLTLELESGAGELYDMVNDPHEMNNVFDDPGYASVRKELEAMAATRPDDAMRPRLTPVGMA